MERYDPSNLITIMTEREDGDYVLYTDAQAEIDRLKKQVKRYKWHISDFLDYFNPRGGISDVPLGPFERAKQALSEEEK